MGLKSEITNEIAAAFATDLKDAVKPFKGSRTTVTQTEADWETNTVTTQDNAYSYNGKGVFDSYRAFEIDGETVQQNDVKLTFLQGSIKPSVDDTISNVDGTYSVVAVGKDPADVTWELQLRKLGTK